MCFEIFGNIDHCFLLLAYLLWSYFWSVTFFYCILTGIMRNYIRIGTAGKKNWSVILIFIAVSIFWDFRLNFSYDALKDSFDATYSFVNSPVEKRLESCFRLFRIFWYLESSSRTLPPVLLNRRQCYVGMRHFCTFLHEASLFKKSTRLTMTSF